MCGICGINGYVDYNMWYINYLLIANEVRGRDATGFAYSYFKNGCDKKDVYINKLGVTASAFVSMFTREIYTLQKVNNIIGHTRSGTGGTPLNNANNHPFRSDKYVLIHNGVLFNDYALTDTYSLERKSETDSEVIPLLMDKLGVKNALEKLRGSFAIAAINTDNPDELILARNSSPLWIGHFKNGALVFSSIRDSLVKIEAQNIFQANEGVIYTYNNGKLVSTEKFEVPEDDWSVYRYWNKKYYSSMNWDYDECYLSDDTVVNKVINMNYSLPFPRLWDLSDEEVKALSPKEKEFLEWEEELYFELVDEPEGVYSLREYKEMISGFYYNKLWYSWSNKYKRFVNGYGATPDGKNMCGSSLTIYTEKAIENTIKRFYKEEKQLPVKRQFCKWGRK